jgi:hypothetical protein
VNVAKHCLHCHPKELRLEADTEEHEVAEILAEMEAKKATLNRVTRTHRTLPPPFKGDVAEPTEAEAETLQLALETELPDSEEKKPKVRPPIVKPVVGSIPPRPKSTDSAGSPEKEPQVEEPAKVRVRTDRVKPFDLLLHTKKADAREAIWSALWTRFSGNIFCLFQPMEISCDDLDPFLWDMHQKANWRQKAVKLGDCFIPDDWELDPVTMDDYHEAVERFNEELEWNEAILFHQFFISRFIVYISNGHGFLCRQEVEGKISWIPMSDDELGKNLKRRRVSVFVGSKHESRYLYDFVKIPLINGSIKVYRDVFFCEENCPYASDPDKRAFYVWEGYDLKPVAHWNPEIVQPWLDFVHDVICNGDDELCRVEQQKNAWMFQHVGLHLCWATVLLGEQGIGKNVYTDTLCKIWGADYTRPNLSSMDMLLNEKSRTVCANRKLVVVNEVVSSESKCAKKSNFDVLKSRITEDYISVRGMYENLGRDQRNITNFIFVSNHCDSIRYERGDRRFFVLKVNPIHKGDVEYWDRLCDYDLKHPDFLDHLLSYYLQMDLTGFDPRNCPTTEAKAELIESAEDTAITFLKQFDWPTGEKNEYCRIKTHEMWQKYMDWQMVMGIDTKYAGHPQKFSSRVQNWLERKKSGTFYYLPSTQLIQYWKTERTTVEEAEDDIEELRKKHGCDERKPDEP